MIMKHLINIVVFILLWGIGYVCGDGVIDNWKDYVSILFYVSGLAWLYYCYG